MTAVAVTHDQQPQGSPSWNQRMQKPLMVLKQILKILFGFWTPMFVAGIYLWKLYGWISQNSHAGKIEILPILLLGIISYLLVTALFVASYSLIGYCMKISFKDTPIGTRGFFESLCVCFTIVCLPTYYCGYFSSRISQNGDGRVYVVNDMPIRAGESLWVKPFVSHAFFVDHKHTYNLKDLEAVTSDGVHVKGRLWFEGELSEDTSQWFNFDPRKEKFTAQLKQVYLDAVSRTPIRDLINPLIISAETGTLLSPIFEDAAIVPSKGATIEAYDFKVLAVMQKGKSDPEKK